ncbi:hypothetical protein NBO_53g0032 [Nosema bombycis CQ1]|uniref:Uncharacterized protein n=1 Tax=Nosema bombycis (strain CQ1 / CVCC 102059) TaxID=578461 RepID=R0MM63_NOSB1|nr:hypothetical protein NBO_53g0032 [Nosema bombycis CQ1]|eukprot:EOB13908.1 hypothetical protein NBO_53g0032 [Nosema bombycis CQ1]
MTKEENKKNEDDEYSILKTEAHKQDSLLKWMSFNKNPTQKSYNLDDIFKDDTFFFKINGGLCEDKGKESIIGKYNTVLSPKKPYLDDMGKLKDNNISLKRYLESTKDDTNLFNINNESKCCFKEEGIKSAVIISDKVANKKDLLANISQIRGDLSK